MEKIIIEANIMIQKRKIILAELKETLKNFKRKDSCYMFIMYRIWKVEDEIDYIKEELREVLKK